MPAVLLPIDPSLPDQRFNCSLDGEQFGFRFYWNERAEQWLFDLSDAAGDIAVGMPVKVGWPMFHQRLQDPRLPKGDAWPIDSSGMDLEAGLGELGGRVQIIYLEATGLL